MADTVLDYNIRLIEIGANNNTWGGKNNDNWQIAVNLFDGTTGFTPNLLTGWKVGGTGVTASATELNKLAGTTGNLLTDAQSDTLTKGFRETPHNNGTISSGTFTPDAFNSNNQVVTNGGAHTWALPSGACNITIELRNNASAGVIDTSAYDRVIGDDLTTTNADVFIVQIIRTNTQALMSIVKMT